MRAKRQLLHVLPVVLLGVLGLGSGAFGSTVLLGGSTPGVSTTYGPLSGENRYRLCHADKVFIGEITSVQSFHFSGPGQAPRIWSKSKMKVERDLANSVGSQVTVVMPGGVVSGVESIVLDSPRPVVGYHYLLGLKKAVVPTPEWPVGTEMFMAAVYLPSDQPLPSEAALQQELSEVCNGI